MEAHTDIDETIKFVNTWDENTDKLLVENQDFKRQIFLLTKKCELSKNFECQARQEIERLHQIVTALQSTLESQMQIVVESEQLKSEIIKLKEEIVLLRAESKQKEVEKKEQIEAMHDFHQAECTNLKMEYEEKLKRAQKSMQDIASEKEKKIQELKELKCLSMREKENAMIKMRLEYDAQLQKLQQKHVTLEPQNIQSSNSSMVRNEILRRKLQHVQVEAQKEIDSLKKKICSLEKTIEEKASQKKRKLSFH